jgi:hypothetical protein
MNRDNCIISQTILKEIVPNFRPEEWKQRAGEAVELYRHIYAELSGTEVGSGLSPLSGTPAQGSATASPGGAPVEQAAAEKPPRPVYTVGSFNKRNNQRPSNRILLFGDHPAFDPPKGKKGPSGFVGFFDRDNPEDLHRRLQEGDRITCDIVQSADGQWLNGHGVELVS